MSLVRKAGDLGWPLLWKPSIGDFLPGLALGEDTHHHQIRRTSCYGVVMTPQDLDDQPPGIYQITWNGSRKLSLAAIGRTITGETWVAPCNWQTVCLPTVSGNEPTAAPAGMIGVASMIERLAPLVTQDHLGDIAEPVMQVQSRSLDLIPPPPAARGVCEGDGNDNEDGVPVVDSAPTSRVAKSKNPLAVFRSRRRVVHTPRSVPA
jgi:hypothetical protein